MLIFNVNFISVAVLAAFYYVFGAIWFSPLMFAKPWLKLLGINKNDIKELKYPVVINYIISIFIALIFVYFFAVLIYSLKINNIFIAIILSLILYFAFNFTAVIKSVLWESKPLLLLLIDTGYDFIAYLIIGIVLTVWK